MDDFNSIFEEVEQKYAINDNSTLTIHNKPSIISLKRISKQTFRANDDYIKERRKKGIITLTPKQMAKKQQREARRKLAAEKAKEREEEKRVEKIAKQISKSVSKTIKKEEKEIRKQRKITAREAKAEAKLKEKQEDSELKRRITPPKKRNIFSRFSNMIRYNRGDFEFEEEDVLAYKNGELSIEDLEDEWKEIQRYEDAKDDVKLRKGWNAFKITLAGLALAGSLFACKTAADKIEQQFNQMQSVHIEHQSQLDKDLLEKRAEGAALRLEDQKFFYEYTDGEPTLQNWEALPEELKAHVRNPVKAAEAAYNHSNDQSHFYVMVDGDFTTEAWQNLPSEVRRYIREPVSTAKEYFENGQDQVYLYELSRGKLTEEFYNTLPAEVRQYVRNPIELAKEFAEQGDATGYLRALSINQDMPERARHEFWYFLPDELKEYVPDPNTIRMDEKEEQIANTENIQNDTKDYER